MLIGREMEVNEQCGFVRRYIAIHHGWAGRAFERVCIQHLTQIKAALGFSAVISTAHSWVYKVPKGEGGIPADDGAPHRPQRRHNQPLRDEVRLRARKAIFVRETQTRKAVMLTMVTPYGLKSGAYADDIPCQVLMEGLF